MHALSPRYGRRSFVTTVSRTTPMALFLPLNILEGRVTENTRSELWRLNGISAKYPLNSIRNDIFKNTMTLFLSELLFRTIRDGALEDGLYEWCERSILTLDALQGDYSNFHLRFMTEFAAALGFRPSADDILPLAGECAAPLLDIMEKPFAEAMLVPVSGAMRNKIAGVMVTYLSEHTESEINVRSLKILRELYGGI